MKVSCTYSPATVFCFLAHSRNRPFSSLTCTSTCQSLHGNCSGFLLLIRLILPTFYPSCFSLSPSCRALSIPFSLLPFLALGCSHLAHQSLLCLSFLSRVPPSPSLLPSPSPPQVSPGALALPLPTVRWTPSWAPAPSLTSTWERRRHPHQHRLPTQPPGRVLLLLLIPACPCSTSSPRYEWHS